MDEKVHIFSEAEKKLALDFSKFDLSHDQRVFGPSYSKFFF